MEVLLKSPMFLAIVGCIASMVMACSLAPVKNTTNASFSVMRALKAPSRNMTKRWDTNSGPLEQCVPEKVIEEVILAGGMYVGGYTPLGKYLTDQQCLAKCCEEPSCDAVFMVNSSCYSVTCSSISNCTLQQAKPSNLKPRVAFVTRWDREGVRKTLFGNDRQLPWQPNSCPKMVQMDDITVKNDLQSGLFTDSGTTTSLQECYDVCCQQMGCNLAFLLENKCFTVKCSKTVPVVINMNKVQVCEMKKATKSSFVPRPKAAHVYSRIFYEPISSFPSPSISNWEPKPINMVPAEIPVNNSDYDSTDPQKLGSNTFPSYDSNSLQTIPLKFEDIKDNLLKMNGYLYTKNHGIIPINNFVNLSDSSNPSAKQSCPVTQLFDNVFLQEGYFSGNFVTYPNTNIFECQESCCQDPTCHVAVIADNKCYGVHCNSPQSCKVLRRSEPFSEKSPGWQVIFVRDVLTGAIIIESSDLSAYEASDDTTMPIIENVTAAAAPPTSDYFAFGSQPLAPKTQQQSDPQLQPQLQPQLETQQQSQPQSQPQPVMKLENGVKDLADTNTSPPTSQREENKNQECLRGPVLKEVVVKKGEEGRLVEKLSWKAASITTTMEECVDMCCSIVTHNDSSLKACHIALLVEGECFGVQCLNEKNCAPTKNPSKSKSASAVIVRPHGMESAKNEFQEKIDSNVTAPIEDQEPTCDHGEVISNVTLVSLSVLSKSSVFSFSKSTLNPASFKELGRNVTTMRRCIEMCCNNEKCDAAVLKNRRCISVDCSKNPSTCRTTSTGVNSQDNTQVSFIKRRSQASEGNILSASDHISRRDIFVTVSAFVFCVLVLGCAILALVLVRRNGRKKPKKNPKASARLSVLRDLSHKKPYRLRGAGDETLLEDLLTKASKQQRQVKVSKTKTHK